MGFAADMSSWTWKRLKSLEMPHLSEHPGRPSLDSPEYVGHLLVPRGGYDNTLIRMDINAKPLPVCPVYRERNAVWPIFQHMRGG
jgi:hypothetical protein